ncbi:MAG: tetratricopeptide repeat protein [Chitinivibrionales bacterium]|nr:tetratricopeptide repeat protein [Chitinivibrionales bacterium]MBD3397166.1 tetratricopeptide repeat protein [Chitinivibrionales bacterium]
MKSKALAVLTLLAFCVYSRTRVAVFPLENTTGDPLVEWVGQGVPEYFFRTLDALPGIQVWDPVLIMQVDSSAWKFDSDSLLSAHARRWKWDIAVGGLFKATDDSVWLRLRSVRPAAGQLAKKEWRTRGALSEYAELRSKLLFEVLVSVGYEFAAKDAAGLKTARVRNAEAYATFARGYGYEMRGKAEDALSSYLHAIEFDKSLGEAHYRMGVLYRTAGVVEKAREALEKAVSLMPDRQAVVAEMAAFLVENESVEASEAFVSQHRSILETGAAGMRAIGMSFIATGEYSRAIAILTRAVAAGPSGLATDFTLGQAYLASGLFAQAADVFNRLIAYRPRHSRYYALLGSAYRQEGRLMESSRVLELAVNLEPRDISNLVNLSNTYFRIGWYEKAEQVLRRALEIDSSAGAVYLNLGVVYWHTGNAAASRDMFAKASQHAQSIQSAFNNEANILFLAGDIKNAVKAYRRADKVGKKNEVVLFNLGQAYRALGKKKEAAVCFDEVLLLSPARLDVLTVRAKIAEELGEEEDAEQYYRKIVQSSPQNREALSRLIKLLVSHERFEEAAEFVKEALEDFPGDRVLRLMLPEIYLKMEWYKVAVMEYEALIADAEFKEEPQCYLGLGRAHFELIRTQNARNYDATISYLKKAVELDPRSAEPEILMGILYMDYKEYPSQAMEHWRNALSKAESSATRRKVRTLMAEARE